tara:strand:- start:38 stop:859 length:822 start_codon:yes stop_codon:yes gene_type:complete
LKIIEIIGPPCSGKTYLRNFLKNELKKKGIKTHTYFSIFFKYVFNEKKLSIIDVITLYYFKYFKFKKENKNIIIKSKEKKSINKYSLKNPLSRFLYKNYYKICEKLTKENNSNFQKKLFSKIRLNKKINNNNRNAYLWFIEIFAILNIIKKYNKNNDIILDDEGIFQKLFIFAEIKFEYEFIKNYMQFANIVNLLLHINSGKKDIIQRSNERKLTNKFSYKNKVQLNKIINFDKKIVRYLKKNRKLQIKEIYSKNKYQIINRLILSFLKKTIR